MGKIESPKTLLELPLEIRRIIYDFLIEDDEEAALAIKQQLEHADDDIDTSVPFRLTEEGPDYDGQEDEWPDEDGYDDEAEHEDGYDDEAEHEDEYEHGEEEPGNQDGDEESHFEEDENEEEGGDEVSPSGEWDIVLSDTANSTLPAPAAVDSTNTEHEDGEEETHHWNEPADDDENVEDVAEGHHEDLPVPTATHTTRSEDGDNEGEQNSSPENDNNLWDGEWSIGGPPPTGDLDEEADHHEEDGGEDVGDTEDDDQVMDDGEDDEGEDEDMEDGEDDEEEDEDLEDGEDAQEGSDEETPEREGDVDGMKKILERVPISIRRHTKYRHTFPMLQLSHCPLPTALLCSSKQFCMEARDHYYSKAALYWDITKSFAHEGMFMEICENICKLPYGVLFQVRKVVMRGVWDSELLLTYPIGDTLLYALWPVRIDRICDVLSNMPQLERIELHWHDTVPDSESGFAQEALRTLENKLKARFNEALNPNLGVPVELLVKKYFPEEVPAQLNPESLLASRRAEFAEVSDGNFPE